MNTIHYTQESTKKEIVQRNDGIIVLPCGSQIINLISKFDSRTAYNCGVYGWNFDSYEVGAIDVEEEFPFNHKFIAICTGYRSLPKATHKLTSSTIEKFDILKKMIESGDYKFYECMNFYNSIEIEVYKI